MFDLLGSAGGGMLTAYRSCLSLSAVAELTFFPPSEHFSLSISSRLSVVGDLHCSLDVCGRLLFVVAFTLSGRIEIDLHQLRYWGGYEHNPNFYILYF